jgi:uncharacterized protein YfaS (alpha-2-macroglobulin family)
VRGDFVLSPNVPLAVTPGDEFDVSVGVSNNLAGSGKDAAIAVGLKTSAHLQVLGSATQILKISEQRESVALFRLKVLDGPGALLGSATLNFSAALGAKGATLATDVSVRPAVAKRTQLSVGSFNGAATVPVTRDMFAQYRNLDAAVSTVPLVLASGLSSYLASFEHPCTEQLVSQAMPLLVLSQRPEFNGAGARLPTARSLDDTWRILRSRQNAEGGFGLWDAAVEADEFASIHALQLMQEARERGVAVPSDMLQKAVAYAASLAASPASTLPDLRVRAYAAYLLTRQMIVTTPMLTAIRESLEARFPKVWQDDLAAAYLASAYQLQKQDSAAGKLIDRQVAMLVKRPADFAYDHYYDPSIRDAQLLTLLSRHFPARAKALPASVMTALVKPVAEQRFNTLSSAYLILAFDAYATALGPDAVGKLGIEQIGADGKAVALTLPANSMPRVPFAAGTSKLRLSNDSSVPAYYAITESGYDRQVPKTELRAGLEVQREFIGADGKALSVIKVGDEVTVRLRLRAVDAAFVPNVALVDLMPGGFEPVLDSGAAPAAEDGVAPAKPARNLAGLAGARASDSIYYANAREDRVVFYGTASGDVSEITYRIKATNSGTFVVPPAYAESMYVRALQARSAGGQTLLVAPVTKAK